MSMSKVEEAIVEMKAVLAQLEPEHEGLRDYAALNLEPSTKAVVLESIAQYDRRTQLIQAALTACDALVADGYPTLATREIGDTLYRDLVNNSQTIRAALAKFSSGRATGLALEPGVVEPK